MSESSVKVLRKTGASHRLLYIHNRYLKMNQLPFHRETEPVDDPNRISSVRILRRSAPGRPMSLRTAYEKREEDLESHNCPPKRRPPKRHFISRHRSNSSPKYEDHSIHIRKEPSRRRRKSGSRVKTKTTQIVPVVSKQEAPFSSLTPTCSRLLLQVGEHGQMMASADKIPASLLLSLARKSIDREADWFGHKRCLMDVILDLRDLARQSTSSSSSSRAPTETEGVLSLVAMAGVGTGQFNPDSHPLCYDRTYTFRDQSSLDVYWNDQAAILTGSIWLNDHVGHSGFPVSVERSTASWPDPAEVMDGQTLNRR